MAALVINGVALRLGEHDLLKGVSLAVAPGKVAALLGPAGSGKTMLLRAAAGLETPQAGTIKINLDTVFDATRKIELPPEERGVGFMFQSGALWPHWTVRDNLVFSARPRTQDTAEARARANRILEQLELAEIAGVKPGQLSAANQRCVALARALVGEPRLLLLDEPLGGLGGDPDARIWLRQQLARSGVAALIATRDRSDALALADHVALINAGVIEQEGAAADLLSRPATPFVANFMGASNRIEGTLVEKAGPRAFIEVMGARLAGVACTGTETGGKATAVIRIERVLLGGGPGANRIPMRLAAQTYTGNRFELTFVKDGLTIRAQATTALRHELYHVEFPPDALWIY